MTRVRTNTFNTPLSPLTLPPSTGPGNHERIRLPDSARSSLRNGQARSTLERRPPLRQLTLAQAFRRNTSALGLQARDVIDLTGEESDDDTLSSSPQRVPEVVASTPGSTGARTSTSPFVIPATPNTENLPPLRGGRKSNHAFVSGEPGLTVKRRRIAFNSPEGNRDQLSEYWKTRGFNGGELTNTMYRTLFGKDAAGLIKERGNSQSARTLLNAEELGCVQAVEKEMLQQYSGTHAERPLDFKAYKDQLIRVCAEVCAERERKLDQKFRQEHEEELRLMMLPEFAPI